MAFIVACKDPQDTAIIVIKFRGTETKNTAYVAIFTCVPVCVCACADLL